MSWPGTCIRREEPLSNHTSFRIGGPAEWFAEPSSVEELAAVIREADRLGLPISVIGGGTNTLAADRGVRGLVIHLGSAFRKLETIGATEDPVATVRCGSAVLSQRLVMTGAREGWDLVEILAGLPGQVGGAVVMNAQGIGRFVQGLTIISSEGRIQCVDRDALHFGYRSSALPSGVIVEAILAFPRIPVEEADRNVQAILSRRNATQDLNVPSAGCAFRNPEQGPAGKFIDDAGLKGSRIGDAQVSLRHANFIVNMGQASADDVLSLMEYVQGRVWRRFSVALEPEVRLLGESWAI